APAVARVPPPQQRPGRAIGGGAGEGRAQRQGRVPGGRRRGRWGRAGTGGGGGGGRGGRLEQRREREGATEGGCHASWAGSCPASSRASSARRSDGGGYRAGR